MTRKRAASGSGTVGNKAKAGLEKRVWLVLATRHMGPQGMAGFVLANGSMSSKQSGEGDICRALIKHYLVGCMFALPGQIINSTQIPVCLWFLAKTKAAATKCGIRGRRKQTLFIDARARNVAARNLNPFVCN